MEIEKYNEIEEKLVKTAQELGYDAAGFEIVDEDGVNIVRLFIEMPGGITTEDCERVSRKVSAYLDTEADNLPEHYLLEVSSPGIAYNPEEEQKGQKKTFKKLPKKNIKNKK